MKVSVSARLPSWPGRCFVALYLLEFVGAAAVSGLGWVTCQALELPRWPYLPLWWAGYLFVYNSDRLYRDPADRTNAPVRSAWADRLRPWRLVVGGAAVLVLLLWPLLTRRAWLLPAIAGAGVALQFYSRPFPAGRRWRFKDLPGLKSSLAAMAIAVMVITWPCREAGRPFSTQEALVFAWAFFALQVNALVCDVRDLAGDRRFGTRTVAVWLGLDRTRGLIYALLCFHAGLSLMLACQHVLTPAVALSAAGGACALGSLLAAPEVTTGFWMGVVADLFLLAPALGACA